MNIYQCSQKKIKKQIQAFQKTSYGKTVFCLAYAVPIVSVLLFIIVMISMMIWNWCWYFFFVSLMIPFFLFFTLISFVVGSAYYYKELREFIAAKADDNK